MHISPPSVCIKDTGDGKGLGVFATRAYRRGEVVEMCPVLVFRMPFDAVPREIKTRMFDWRTLANAEGTYAIPLGCGSVYNHDNPANMRYEAVASGRFLRFVALRDIEAGEELTINYNGQGGVPEGSDTNWFEEMHVRRIVGAA